VPHRFRFRFAASAALCAALALGVFACNKGGGDGAESGEVGAATGEKADDKPVVKKKPSVRPTLSTFRPLLEESARAEVDAGGLLVDFGAGDQHKFTRGSWKTSWGERKTEGGTTFVEMNTATAHFDAFVHSGAIQEVVLRTRSPIAGQRIAIRVDGKEYGAADVGAEWGLARVTLGANGVPAGRHRVQIYVAKPNPSGARLQVDWAWLRTAEGAGDPVMVPRLLTVKLAGSPKRALPTPTSRTYSFYLHPPAGGQLVFDYGSDKPTDFKVRATVDDGAGGTKTEELFASAGKAEWEEAKVDLSAYAGKATRLDLVAEGQGGLGGWGEPEVMIAPDSPSAAAGAKPKNVMVILVDTVRADVFAAWNPDNDIKTPVFDRLVSEGVAFKNAYNNENWTKPSVATLLSGLYPATHNTKKDSSALPEAVEILPQRMKKAGFATGGFVANGYVSNKFGFEKGWDFFTNYIRESRTSDASVVFKEALEWIVANKDKPQFVYIQTIDPHVVYKVDERFSGLYFEGQYTGPLGSSITAQNQIDIGKGKLKVSERDMRWLKALYYGEVSFHDEYLGQFVAELEKMGWLDDTLVVLTNDHGEELREHGRLGHGHSLYDELLRSPLAIRYPKMFKPAVLDEVVESVDVTPTILDLMGVPPAKDADGLSLAPLLRGEPVPRPYYAISEFLDSKRAVRVGPWKLVVGGREYELFDVVSDPGETENQAEKANVALRTAEVYLGEGLSAPTKTQRRLEVATVRKFKASDADIDPELRKQLEALGYFGE